MLHPRAQLQDVQARVPDTSSPLPDIEATDLTRGGSPLLREKAEEHLAEVLVSAGNRGLWKGFR